MISENKLKELKKEFENATEEEKYEFTWIGKKESKKEAYTKTNKVLCPCKEESVNWNTTENLYIEGDNLDALKLLQENYLGKVKMIYIDPPYNTGGKTSYRDNFKYYGIDKKHVAKNTTKEDLMHSGWCNLMYPRLMLARSLLSDDGVIFISIDDNEVHNLRNICDEVFGGKNFVAICPRKTRGSATTKSDAEIQKLNDYILIYWKEKFNSAFNLRFVGEKQYPYNDERGQYYIVPLQDNGPHGTRTARPNLYYPIYQDDSGNLSLERKNKNDKELLPSKHKNDDGRWMWSKDKFQRDYKDLCVKNKKVYIKHYFNPDEDQNKYQREKNWLDSYLNGKGTLLLNDTVEIKGVFNNPKPIELINLFASMATHSNDIILDFFSGSATTAHAVMQLNAEDGGNRKFIMVQLDEPCDEKSEAFKAGYKNICEIGKERIRRAGKKIIDENPDKADSLDIGFKVFKIV